MRTNPILLRSFAALLLALPLPAAAAEQAASPDDLVLAEYLDQVARRDTLGLVPRPLADGHQELALEGRFQQVTLARLGPEGEPMLGCAGSLDEAQRFFGRDLLTGKALPSPPTATQDDDLAARASRHGLTPMQQRRYESMIDLADRAQGAKSAAFTVTQGAGFNDATAATPVGGNPGTTRGQQRLNLFLRAMQIWGATLDSTVVTNVAATFSALPCSAGGATLAAAGPTSAVLIVGQGIGGPGGITFPVALANKLLGSDQNGATSEINATVNSSIDTGCLGADARFYYGFDTNTPAGQINLLVVLLHELGHGLGFLSLMETDGTYPFERSDMFSRFQRDQDTGQSWSQMQPAARLTSSTNANDVIWDGANVRIASGFLTAAREADGSVETFTPTTFQAGSSISHWNSTASPNLLMEPAINAAQGIDLDLTPQLLRDLGWFRDANSDGVADTITNVAVGATSFTAGQQATVTWTNSPGFAGPVTLELSTDGGTTFPVTLASGVANTGSRAVTVPNNPTTQARVRVREDDFAAPSGVSTANFTISANATPVITASAPLSRTQGSPAGAAVTLATTSDAETPAGSLAVTVVPGGTATGVTVGPITNTNGTISATVAASCTATSGTVRLQSSDGVASAIANLQVNVPANTVPTLAYGNTAVTTGFNLVVNPFEGPSDNGSIQSIMLQSPGTFTGGVALQPGGVGVVLLTNAAPVGNHVVTVRATDNCGAIHDAAFDVLVTPATNTAPTFVPVGSIARQQGSTAGAGLAVGTASDAQTAATALTMSQVAGGTATGITISNFAIAANGTVFANAIASCSATSGTVRLQVSDGSLTGTGDLQVNVSANTPPSLTYPAAVAGSPGGSLTVSPLTGPADNGSVAGTTLVSQGTYTGTISVGAANAVVSLSNLQPAGGPHTITVRTTDNCGATRDASFPLTITASNTPPAFTPAAALTRQRGSPAGPAVVLGTASDAQTAASGLTILQVGGAGVTATSVTASNLVIASDGTVTSPVAAACLAQGGTIGLRVDDGDLSTLGLLQVNVTDNTAATLTYAPVSGAAGTGLVVTPSAGPSDNGSIQALILNGQGSFTGSIVVDPATGAATISNLGPVGVHTVFFRTTDNCGLQGFHPLQITVTEPLPDELFRNGFEPPQR